MLNRKHLSHLPIKSIKSTALLLVALMLFSVSSFGQSLKGAVRDKEGKALVGASLHWLGTTIGTTTDGEGRYEIKKPDSKGLKIVVSYLGYNSDTTVISYESWLNFILEASTELEEVVIESDRRDNAHDVEGHITGDRQ